MLLLLYGGTAARPAWVVAHGQNKVAMVAVAAVVCPVVRPPSWCTAGASPAAGAGLARSAQQGAAWSWRRPDAGRPGLSAHHPRSPACGGGSGAPAGGET